MPAPDPAAVFNRAKEGWASPVGHIMAVTGLHLSGRNRKSKKLIVASWNIRTMLDGVSRPERRTAQIAKELQRYRVNIAALQETRVEGQGQVQEENYSFFWVGKTEGRRDAGVAFAVDNKIKLTTLPTFVSERMMVICVPIDNNMHLTIVNVYAPTMTYPDEEKEAFYQELTTIVSRVPPQHKLLVVGDFNARVGSDCETYAGIIGKFGKGKKNTNGDLLLHFCAQQELCLTNTFFSQPDKNFFTWKHPRSGHYHLLDYIVTRRSGIHEIMCTKVMRGAECSTDHYLLSARFARKFGNVEAL
ncbi:hypothetical protein PO909_012565 [Leuciscus waleckii]